MSELKTRSGPLRERFFCYQREKGTGTSKGLRPLNGCLGKQVSRASRHYRDISGRGLSVDRIGCDRLGGMPYHVAGSRTSGSDRQEEYRRKSRDLELRNPPILLPDPSLKNLREMYPKPAASSARSRVMLYRKSS